MLWWLSALALVVLIFGAAGLAPVFPLPSRQGRVAAFTFGASAQPLSITMTTATSSPDATAVGDMTGLAIGSVVTGTGIPVGTTVIAMDNTAHTLTLSANATATHTGAYTFTNPAGLLRTQGANFRLANASFTPSVNTTLADLTPIECAFDGYTAKVLSMNVGYIDGTSTPYAQSQLLSWNKTPGVNTESVYGWWIDDGTNVIACALYNGPVAMATVGAELSGVFADGYPTGSGWQALIPASA